MARVEMRLGKMRNCRGRSGDNQFNFVNGHWKIVNEFTVKSKEIIKFSQGLIIYAV